MPEDTRKNEHPYADKNPLPAIVAVVFLLVMGYGALQMERNSASTETEIDAREVYDVPDPETLTLVTEIPTLYESRPVAGQGRIAGLVGARGLWLIEGEDSVRVLGVLSPELAGVSLAPGQNVKIKGEAYRTRGLHRISSSELEAGLLTAMEDTEIFIYIERLRPTPAEGYHHGDTPS